MDNITVRILADPGAGLGQLALNQTAEYTQAMKRIVLLQFNSFDLC